MSKTIMGIKIQDRVETVQEVQKLLTEHGCEISTRIGLHMASENACSPNGLILLEFIDNADESIKKLEEELDKLGHVEVQKMVF